MDGIHDLGGKQGFGTVEVEKNEPVFHERWEAGVYTMMNRAMGAGLVGNVDQFRHAIERIDPIAYLTHTYYGRWLGGLENLLTEAGVISTGTLNDRVVERGGNLSDPIAARPDPALGPLPAPEVRGAERDLDRPPAFSVGQLVRTVTDSPSGHTRLPAYARGRVGTIAAVQGCWVFPDTNAHGLGENPECLYSVCFAGEALWGGGGGSRANPSTSIFSNPISGARND